MKKKIERIESLLEDVKNNISGSEELEGFEHRDAYLQEFNRVCERFGVEIELEEDGEMDKDQIFSDWRDEVNMSASGLQKWSKNPCSRQASQKPVTVMKRNLRLLERDKDEWTENDYKDAKRTISFISRMKPNKPDSPREGPHGCPSEWAISLLNWAYNPFDSIPTPSSEVKDGLDSVEKVTLSSELQQGGETYDYEFEPVPDQVLYSTEDLAAERAEEMGLDGVHEHVMVFDGEEVTMYMPGSEHSDWAEKVQHPRQLEDDEELSDSRQASQVVHGDQEKHLGSKKDSDEDGNESVRVPPVAIHKVEGGGDDVQVSEDVEQVLDELWDEDEK